MTPSQLEQQSREAVIAYLQDSSVRLEFTGKHDPVWAEKTYDGFYFNEYYYRIAQTKPWYRVASVIGTTETVNNEKEEKYTESCDDFIKWLTERIEYDNQA